MNSGRNLPPFRKAKQNDPHNPELAGARVLGKAQLAPHRTGRSTGCVDEMRLASYLIGFQCSILK